jgi:hypothetical protein
MKGKGTSDNSKIDKLILDCHILLEEIGGIGMICLNDVCVTILCDESLWEISFENHRKFG